MAVRKFRIDRENYATGNVKRSLGTGPERDHEGSGVLALVRILDGRLLYIRRWQVWMRAFRVRGCSLDRGPGGTDSLLDFLFSRCQRIV